MTGNNEKIDNILKDLTADEKDTLYRKLWEEYIKQDVTMYLYDDDHLSDIIDEYNVDFTKEETDGIIDRVVERYVYEGDYDCELNYWENIDNLINDEAGRLSHELLAPEK